MIKNKQKLFAIYEWILQFDEVAFRWEQALANVNCHLLGIQFDRIIQTTFIAYSFIVQTYTKLPLM